MKLSKYFLKTTKNTSNEEKSISAKYLKQAWYIRESVAGRYYFLPIWHRVQQNIMKIIKEELDDIGCQEMIAPTLHPLELWKETNRTNTAWFELMNVKDRRWAEFALWWTAEEMFVDLVRQYQISYKDLPINLYQFSTKFRDELRARWWLLRVREFIMKDAYSFHIDEEDFKKEYEMMKNIYVKIFWRLWLEVAVVESDNGYIWWEYCHEFIVESDIWESKYFISEDWSYASHEDIAIFKKEAKNIDEPEMQIQEVEAVRWPTMEDWVTLHNLPLWQQIKDVLFWDDYNKRYILTIIRGDFDVNEVKLSNLLKTNTLRKATDEEVREYINSEPWFISPVNIKDNLKNGIELIIVADDSLRTIKNAYGWSNKKNIDILNLNIDRDYKADIEWDIALAKEWYMAIKWGWKLIERKWIEVWNIFQLGYHYSKLMKWAVFTDADDKEKPYYMGCYGIWIWRTMAAVVEKYYDEKGIIWPKSVSPFDIHLISLNWWEEESEKIYEELKKRWINVLFDDRNKTAWEKFADADLIWIPLRLVLSKKTIEQNKIEFKHRQEKESKLILVQEFLNSIDNYIQ